MNLCTTCEQQLYAGATVVRTGVADGAVTFAHIDCIDTPFYDDDVTIYIGTTARAPQTDAVAAYLEQLRSVESH